MQENARQRAKGRAKAKDPKMRRAKEKEKVVKDRDSGRKEAKREAREARRGQQFKAIGIITRVVKVDTKGCVTIAERSAIRRQNFGRRWEKFK